MSKTNKPLESLKELRNQAEKKTKRAFEALHNQSPTRTQELLHELQVHQIELEMQNEELRRSQLELETLRQKYFELFNCVPVGYFSFDSKGIIVEVNLSGAELLGTTKSEILGKGFSHWIDSESQDIFYLHRKVAIDTAIQQTCELKMRKSNGKEFYGQLLSKTESDENGNIKQLLTTLIDITERRQLEEKQLEYHRKLKSMALTLSRTEEIERKKLATQVHDGISQRMAMLRMEIQQAVSSITDSTIASKLNKISSDIHSIIKDSYSLMFELSNPILFELGLNSAIAALLETKILKAEGISWKLSIPEKHFHLKQDIVVILYQAVRELLINAKKHSNASNVEVLILQKEKVLCITIKDDGVGFIYPFEKLPNQEGGFGLFHMKETLYSIGGKLSVISKPNKGSIITITAPLASESI